MAEGFAKAYLGQSFNIYSAGTKKHGMNPLAVKVMSEIGIDLSKHYSKTVDELPSITMDLVVTVCSHAQRSCPFYPGSKMIHKGFDDPPALTRGMVDQEKILNEYRRVRNEIGQFVKSLKPETTSNMDFS